MCQPSLALPTHASKSQCSVIKYREMRVRSTCPLDIPSKGGHRVVVSALLPTLGRALRGESICSGKTVRPVKITRLRLTSLCPPVMPLKNLCPRSNLCGSELQCIVLCKISRCAFAQKPLLPTRPLLRYTLWAPLRLFLRLQYRFQCRPPHQRKLPLRARRLTPRPWRARKRHLGGSSSSCSSSCTFSQLLKPSIALAQGLLLDPRPA